MGTADELVGVVARDALDGRRQPAEAHVAIQEIDHVGRILGEQPVAALTLDQRVGVHDAAHAEADVAREVGQQRDLGGIERRRLTGVDHECAVDRAVEVHRECDRRDVTAVDRGTSPRTHCDVGGEEMRELSLAGPDRRTGRALTGLYVLVPVEGHQGEIAVLMSGPRDRSYGAFRIVHGLAVPRESVAPFPHDGGADLVEQLLPSARRVEDVGAVRQHREGPRQVEQRVPEGGLVAHVLDCARDGVAVEGSGAQAESQVEPTLGHARGGDDDVEDLPVLGGLHCVYQLGRAVGREGLAQRLLRERSGSVESEQVARALRELHHPSHAVPREATGCARLRRPGGRRRLGEDRRRQLGDVDGPAAQGCVVVLAWRPLQVEPDQPALALARDPELAVEIRSAVACCPRPVDQQVARLGIEFAEGGELIEAIVTSLTREVVAR